MKLYNALLAQLLDRLVGISQLAENLTSVSEYRSIAYIVRGGVTHLVRMLRQVRRRTLHGHPSAIVVHSRRNEFDFTSARMLIVVCDVSIQRDI